MTSPAFTPPPAAGLPGYWPNETTGFLRAAVEAYLSPGADLAPIHVLYLRAYFRQWMASPAWRGPEVEALRAGIDAIGDRASCRAWIGQALAIGIDPL